MSTKWHHISKSLSRRTQRRGFTLVELMVAIVIVAALVALSFPIASRVKGSARAAEGMSNVRQLGGAILMHASDNHQKLIPLQPSVNSETGKRPPIWTVQLAREGYMWDGIGELPCGTGVWTCPASEFVSHAYGAYGVVEDTIFVYEERTPVGVSEKGSLRLNRIHRPASTWLVGDAAAKAAQDPKVGWYAIWSQPSRWDTHGPAPRHRGKVNVCMVDGHVEALTVQEIEERELTVNVVRR
ncbi:MAG: prepilin-type N-terminal cleavage/methylation domain-containing protein [Haloferula sp.]